MPFSPSQPIKPLVISGKSYVIIDATTVIRMKKGLRVTEEAVGWDTESQWGPTGKRKKATALKIAGTPEGEITTTFLDYMYALLLTTGRGNLGKSIVGHSVVICDIDNGDTFAGNNAGLFKPSDLMLGPGGTAFGEAQWIDIGDPAKEPNDAAYLVTLGSLGSPDATRNEANIISDLYSLKLGSRSTPFDAMGTMNGLKISIGQTNKLFECGDVGYGDCKAMSVALGASFIPSNLSAAQFLTLRTIQGTGVTMAGQEYAHASEDLTATGLQVGWQFVCKQMGIEKADQFYGADDYRNKEVTFVNRSRSTAGLPLAYLAYTAPS
jgi:hypothetical protein